MFKVNQKGLNVATEEVKQRLVALLARPQLYEARHKHWRQNHLFKTDQKQLYQELGGQEKAKHVVPNATESRKFWSDLWDQPVQHNRGHKPKALQNNQISVSQEMQWNSS